MKELTYIYQIGRLEANMFDLVRFRIDGSTYEKPLSSMALREHFGRERSKLFLLYPVSLFFNRALLSNEKFKAAAPNDLLELIKKANYEPESYLADPKPYFSSIPHSKEADSIIIIHSLGTYGLEQKSVTFHSHYGDICIRILLHMVRNFLSEKETIKEFVIDISSGHNIYVSALIEASRYFAVFSDLVTLEEEGSKVKMTVSFTDPIVGQAASVGYKIYFEPILVRSLFTSPITGREIANDQLAKKLIEGPEHLLRELTALLKSFAMTFSAIKNCAPVAIHHFGFHSPEEIKDFLIGLCCRLDEKLEESYQSSPKLNKDAVIKVLMALGLYIGIVKMLLRRNIQKATEVGVEVTALKESFSDLFRFLGLDLNRSLLGNEVSNLINVKLKGVSELSTWKALRQIIDPNRSWGGLDKRNFFAHSGLENGVTLLRKIGGKVFVKYDPEYSENIRGVLLDAV